MKLLPMLVSIVGEFIWPVMNYNIAELKENQPQLQKLYGGLQSSLSHLKSDHTTRRKRSTTPPPHLSPSQPSKAVNNTPNIESDQNMSR